MASSLGDVFGGLEGYTPRTRRMETTVRNLELKALICEDETNPELGSDDIYTQLTIDSMSQLNVRL